jgi:hypothetical protein
MLAQNNYGDNPRGSLVFLLNFFRFLAKENDKKIPILFSALAYKAAVESPWTQQLLLYTPFHYSID